MGRSVSPRLVRDQPGADGGRVGGPAFRFRWSPRSLSGPQGPRERDGGRGLGAGSGRGGTAAAAGFSERSGAARSGAASPRGGAVPAASPLCG